MVRENPSMAGAFLRAVDVPYSQATAFGEVKDASVRPKTAILPDGIKNQVRGNRLSSG